MEKTRNIIVDVNVCVRRTYTVPANWTEEKIEDFIWDRAEEEVEIPNWKSSIIDTEWWYD